MYLKYCFVGVGLKVMRTTCKTDACCAHYFKPHAEKTIFYMLIDLAQKLTQHQHSQKHASKYLWCKWEAPIVTSHGWCLSLKSISASIVRLDRIGSMFLRFVCYFQNEINKNSSCISSMALANSLDTMTPYNNILYGDKQWNTQMWIIWFDKREAIFRLIYRPLFNWSQI